MPNAIFGNQALILNINRSLSLATLLSLVAITGAAQKLELVVQAGNAGIITVVAYTPDGKLQRLLASGAVLLTISNAFINALASAKSGAVVFAASISNQYSFKDATWNNGAFTKALVEGITGRADSTGQGRITINMLDPYITERVNKLTGGKQTPRTPPS